MIWEIRPNVITDGRVITVRDRERCMRENAEANRALIRRLRK